MSSAEFDAQVSDEIPHVYDKIGDDCWTDHENERGYDAGEGDDEGDGEGEGKGEGEQVVLNASLGASADESDERRAPTLDICNSGKASHRIRRLQNNLPLLPAPSTPSHSVNYALLSQSRRACLLSSPRHRAQSCPARVHGTTPTTALSSLLSRLRPGAPASLPREAKRNRRPGLYQRWYK